MLNIALTDAIWSFFVQFWPYYTQIEALNERKPMVLTISVSVDFYRNISAEYLTEIFFFSADTDIRSITNVNIDEFWIMRVFFIKVGERGFGGYDPVEGRALWILGSGA